MKNLSTKFKARIGLSLLTAGLGGCGMKADVADNSKEKHFFCTDTRDGEKFSFKTSTVSNASVGLFGADTCFDVIVEGGSIKRLCDSHQSFIKCEAKSPNVQIEGQPASGLSRSNAGLGSAKGEK